MHRNANNHSGIIVFLALLLIAVILAIWYFFKKKGIGIIWKYDQTSIVEYPGLINEVTGVKVTQASSSSNPLLSRNGVILELKSEIKSNEKWGEIEFGENSPIAYARIFRKKGNSARVVKFELPPKDKIFTSIKFTRILDTTMIQKKFSQAWLNKLVTVEPDGNSIILEIGTMEEKENIGYAVYEKYKYEVDTENWQKVD